MHAAPSDNLTWHQRLILAGSFALLAVVLASLVLAMVAAHQPTGVVPAPVPAAPVMPGPPQHVQLPDAA